MVITFVFMKALCGLSHIIQYYENKHLLLLFHFSPVMKILPPKVVLSLLIFPIGPDQAPFTTHSLESHDHLPCNLPI